ncbi:nuclease-related domain-containing protein [Neobacillus sp. BF23-41]|uniref:nuclease-related domain-containing protein n=1 Tax=Neobacillus sp. BF23-41 TaxID=3240280 RepID=UPI0034E52B72
MSFKDRIEADEIKILRFLNSRMKLAEKDKIRFRNLVKGFEGEVMFDSLTEKLQCPSYILNDLLLETNNGKFQLDTVMITQDPLYLFEVKNYEGDFYFEGDRFYALPKKEYKNPLHQLQRSESLLRQLLESLGYRIPIEAYVIFINPHFTCYKAPLNEPIIYPNQLPRFMHNLNRRPSTLNGMHKKLADQLVSMHQIELPYDRLPPYDYGKLKKGNICRVCLSLKTTVVNNKLVCEDCGCHEVIDHAVLRVVEEIKLLFPNIKITTNLVHEWCKVVESKKTIRRILKQNYSVEGKKEFGFISLHDQRLF